MTQMFPWPEVGVRQDSCTVPCFKILFLLRNEESLAREISKLSKNWTLLLPFWTFGQAGRATSDNKGKCSFSGKRQQCARTSFVDRSFVRLRSRFLELVVANRKSLWHWFWHLSFGGFHKWRPKTPNRRGRGGSRSTPNLRINSIHLPDKEGWGGGCQKIPKSCGRQIWKPPSSSAPSFALDF